MITFSVRGTGWRALLLLAALAFGLFGVPRLLSKPPSSVVAESAIRDLWSRQVSEAWFPRLRDAHPDSAAQIGESMARDLAEARERKVSHLAIRRSWVGPPFARRWAYFVRVEEPGGESSVYRISRGFAGATSAFWWWIPLF